MEPQASIGGSEDTGDGLSPVSAAILALETARDALEQWLGDPRAAVRVGRLGELMAQTFASGGKLLACGNGGSACDAMHLCEELTGRFRADRAALPAISLTDPGHITCVGNDYGFDRVFARAVEAHAKPGDLLIALSTSGNSANIVEAVKEARARQMRVCCLLGGSGGKLAGEADLEILVPGPTTDRIQELHMLALHVAIEVCESVLFPGA